MNGIQDAPVRVELGDRVATWTLADGFTGDPGLVGRAKFAAYVGLEVPLGDTTVIASDATTTGAAAALVTFDPDRVRITAGPADLIA